jgi:outer membrane protein
MHKILIVVAATIVTSTICAQKVAMFSAADAVEYARKNNAAVKNALIDVDIQRQTNREITAAAFPQINGSTSINYAPNVTTQTFPNFIAAATYGVLQQEGVKNGSGAPITAPADFGFVQAQFGTKFTNTAGVDLQQLLFEGQVFVGLQARRASIEFAEKNVEVTEEVIKANILKIYYQLAASSNQVKILNTNIERLEKLASDTRKIFESGFAERLDVDKVTVQLNNLQTERQKVLNTISNGYLGLKLLMGFPVNDSIVLTDSVTYEQIQTGVLDMAYSYDNRKEVQYAELGKKLNQFNIKRYQLSRFPTVALGSNYTYIRQSDKFGFGGKWNPSSQIALRVSVPIFDGFARDARIQKAKLQLQQTENRISELKMSIDREVQQAVNNYRSGLATLEIQKRNMELAERVYEQTKKKYELGQGSTIEISNADAELRIAQTNYISAMYDAIISKIDFQKATGTL